jgi:hypothetical protein
LKKFPCYFLFTNVDINSSAYYLALHSLGRSSNHSTRNRRRDHRDKSAFPSSQTSNLSSSHLANKYAGNNAQSPHSSDHKGGSGTSGSTASGIISTSQNKRRLSGASNTSATSDHGGSSSSRPQSPPVNGSRRGVYRK